jgi:hypothetical protein
MSIIEARHGRKAKARQPHKMLMVQGELTRFAIYNQQQMRNK